MRRVLTVVAVLAASIGLGAQDNKYVGRVNLPNEPKEILVDSDRIDRVAGWLEAVEEHEPGERDSAARRIASWAREDVASLEIDAWSLAALASNLRTSRFTVKDEGTGDLTRIEYPKPLLERMRALACVAAGLLGTEECTALHAERDLDPMLTRMAARAAAARQDGDRNYFLRRAAMLHTDIVTLRIYSAGRVTLADSAREQFFALNDGQVTGMAASPEHWDIARTLLDRVVPAGGRAPKPAADPMVRAWYIATISWLEGTYRHSAQQMLHALKIFKDDADIQFLAGWQHESFASPSIQEPMRTAVPRPGYKIPVREASDELRAAEACFRRALELQPSMMQARLRLGFVLLRQARFADAAESLRQPATELAEPALKYDAQLFLAAAEEGLGHVERAEAAYRAASALYPTAQSPLVGLSQLAWKGGRREAALDAMSRLFAIPAEKRDDPWFTYEASAVADPVSRLDALRRQLADSWR